MDPAEPLWPLEVQPSLALEAQYDNDSALLWDKSCEAIGGDFTIG